MIITSLLSAHVPLLAQESSAGSSRSERHQRNATSVTKAKPPIVSQRPNNKTVSEIELNDDHYAVSLKEVKSQEDQSDARATPLSVQRTKELLANWARYQSEIPISKEPVEKKLVTAVVDRQPAPAVPAVQAFNSKTSAPRSDVAAPHTELTVLSVMPMNSVVRAQTIAIQFSEQMVPLSTIGTTMESPPDIEISPPLKGRWEWLDPKTLNFKSEADHFPMATKYTAEIGTDLKSVAGTSLSAPFKWQFQTSPVSSLVVPAIGITDKYYVPLECDQEIDSNDAFKHITAKYKKRKLHVALVDEAEIRNKFPDLRDTKLLADNRMFLKILDIVPPESVVEISLSKNCPSKEGPLLSEDVATVTCAVGHRDRPQAPFAFIPQKGMNRAIPLGQNIALNFNCALGDVDVKKYVTVEPALKDQNIYRQNNEVIVSGLPTGKTQHKVRISRDLTDTYGRSLPRDVLVPLSFGPVPPILLNSGAGGHETIRSKKSKSYSIYSVNVPAIRVRVFKRSEDQLYPKIERAEPAGSDTQKQDLVNSSEEQDRLAKAFFPKPDKDFLIYPHSQLNQICKSEIQLGDMLSNGFGHLRLVAQAYTKDAAERTERYFAAAEKNKTKTAVGKTKAEVSESNFEKKKPNNERRAVTPPSYNPVTRGNRLINARIGQQGRGNGSSNGVFETTLQFTNLAASTIRAADGKLYCRVTELDSGLPIAGAKVRFICNPYVWKINRGKKPNESILENVVECADVSELGVAGGVGEDVDQSPVLETDTRGLAAIPAVQLKPKYAEELKNVARAPVGVFGRGDREYRPNAFVVSRDNDVLYVDDVQPGLRAPDENFDFCCTDRNLYKPGEKVDVKGWIRTRAALPNADLQMSGLKPRRIYYSIRSSQKEIATGDTELGYLDSLQFRFGLPVDVDLGNGVIQIFSDAKHTNQLAQTQFQIEEFRAPEFEITVKKQDAAPKYLNEPTRFVVKANYFGSGPLTGARVDWTVRLQNASFSPPNWFKYCFQKNYRYFNGARRTPMRTEKPQIPAEFKSKTDKVGSHTLEVVATTYDGTQPVMVNAEATVRDLNQQRWAGSESSLLHPADVYVGLSGDKVSVPQGDELEGQLVTVDVDGKLVTNCGVELQLLRELEGRDDNVSEQIAVQTLTSGTEPAKFHFPAKYIGNYFVVATVKDKRGRRHQSSLNYSVHRRPEQEIANGQPAATTPRTFKAEPNKRVYEAGDVAEIVVACPKDRFSGWAALIDRGVQKVVPFASTTGQYVLNVPLNSESIPQCTVRIEIVTEADAARETLPETYSAQLSLPISTKSRELAVVARPRLSVILPGQNNTIDFRVSKSDGTPAANADLCAIVVDEAVLALTNYQFQNLLESFYRSGNYGRFWQVGVRDSRAESALNTEFEGVYKDWKSNLTLEMIQRYWSRQGFNTNSGPVGFVPMGNGRIGFEILNGQAIPLSQLLLNDHPLAQLGGFDRYTFFPGVALTPPIIKTHGYAQYSMGGQHYSTARRVRPTLYSDAGRVEGPRDLNLFQVEPTVVDERHYTSGRDERHQKTIPILPLGGPIPDAEGNSTPVANVRVRTNFGPLALFKPNLRTDKDGRASVTFTAPDSLTRYRVVALVAQEEKYFGKAEANIVVDQPLTLRPSPPRFANVEDRFDVPIVVTNSDSKSSTIEIAGCAEGAAEGENGYKVDLEPNQRVTVLVHAAGKCKGVTEFRCVARAQSGFADKIVRALPVIESPTTEQFAQYGTISGGAINEEIRLPDASKTSGSMLDLKTSASAITELHAAASYLRTYPFGCSEQLSSQILVFAAIKGMPKELGQMLATREDLFREQDVIDELAKRMLPDGSFTLWGERDRHRYATPFLTAQCAHAMLMAKESGYKVDENLMRTIRNGLRLSRFNRDDRAEEFHRRTRAYTIYVHHLFGDDCISEAQSLLPDEKSIRDAHTEILCWLLPVIQKHDPEKGKQILARLYNTIEETASTAFVQDKQPNILDLFCTEGSSRSTAVTLETLCLAQPDHPLIPKLAKGLLLQRGNGHWLNTNDDAFAFRALNKYFSIYEKDNPDFAVDAWLNGLHYVHGKFTKRAAPPMLATFRLGSEKLADAKSPEEKLATTNSGAKGNLVLRADGPGRLYYRIGLRYALKNPIQKSLDRGIHVTREYAGAYDRSEVAVQDDGTVLVKKGATVKITAHVYAPGERFYSALVDHLPAGFESVNTSLSGSTQTEQTAERGPHILRQKRAGANSEKAVKESKEEIYETPYYDFDAHQNLRDDRTEVFRNKMSAGHYVYSYLARATTTGSFLAPPMKIEEMYTPETFGRTNSVLVKIVDEMPPSLIFPSSDMNEDDANNNESVQPQIDNRELSRQLSPALPRLPTLPEGSPIPDNE
ncbi:MAG TPA: alpha-2-macroglobulin family protein [Oculatellaceae cyanobacterium]